MLKLMKYEFRKQAFSKLIIAILAALVEVVFAYGMIVNDDTKIGLGLGLMGILAFGSLLVVSFECILTYSNDLKTKCGYMLFMVPHSTYTVIGAKVLATVLQIIMTGLLFVLLEGMNAFLVIARYESISKFIDYIQRIFNVNISWSDIAFVLGAIIVAWISVVILAFFSITLSTTFLANKKGKGIVSFIIFLLINWGFNSFITSILGSKLSFTRTDYILEMLLTTVFTAIIYVGTSYMLEEKVSL